MRRDESLVSAGLHRIGDPLRHPAAERSAEHDKHDRRRQHAAIELIDLLLDFALSAFRGTVTMPRWRRRDRSRRYEVSS
ncbi:MAG: hypothetical protein U0Q11_19325 [Vicinamibacterales bacterium]